MYDVNVSQESTIQNASEFARYFAICSAISLLMCLYCIFFSDESYGFWGWIAILIFYAFIPAVCVTIGSFLRKLAMPSFIFTGGGMTGLLKAKIFWAVGPQIIGWIVGILIAAQLLEKWFDISLR